MLIQLLKRPKLNAIPTPAPIAQFRSRVRRVSPVSPLLNAVSPIESQAFNPNDESNASPLKQKSTNFPLRRKLTSPPAQLNNTSAEQENRKESQEEPDNSLKFKHAKTQSQNFVFPSSGLSSPPSSSQLLHEESTLEMSSAFIRELVESSSSTVFPLAQSTAINVDLDGFATAPEHTSMSIDPQKFVEEYREEKTSPYIPSDSPKPPRIDFSASFEHILAASTAVNDKSTKEDIIKRPPRIIPVAETTSTTLAPPNTPPIPKTHGFTAINSVSPQKPNYVPNTQNFHNISISNIHSTPQHPKYTPFRALISPSTAQAKKELFTSPMQSYNSKIVGRFNDMPALTDFLSPTAANGRRDFLMDQDTFCLDDVLGGVDEYLHQDTFDITDDVKKYAVAKNDVVNR